MIKLDDILQQWKIATGNDPSGKTIRIGHDSDWLISKAIDNIEKDDTGVISSLYLRLAFKSLIQEQSYSIKELLDNKWDEDKKAFIQLKNMLFNGEVGIIFDNFIKLIIRHCEILGKKFTTDDILNIDKIEDIISTAVTDYNCKYKIHKERFSDGKIVKNENVSIFDKLYRFDYLQQFVQVLKDSCSDNFICLALIDRTYADNRCEYDDKYDSFFAYGVKNNGVVYIISDREILRSPETIFKTRNPGRSFYNKVSYSWMPYFMIDRIKSACNVNHNVKLLSDSDNTEMTSNALCNIFDDAGIIYTSLMMTLIYKQYFIDIQDNSERLYFSSEIKYLPKSVINEVALRDELQIAIPDITITADTYKADHDDEKIFNTGVFDHYLNRYQFTDHVKFDLNIIANKDDAAKLAWWRTRKAQSDFIEEQLEIDADNNYNKICGWIDNQINSNFSSILNFMITQKETDCINTTVSLAGTFGNEIDKSGLPIFWQYYKDGKDIDTYALREVSESFGEREKFKPYSKVVATIQSILGTAILDDRHNIIFQNDNSNRYYELRLDLRSYSDLKKFFNFEVLPTQLDHWVHMTSGGWGTIAWVPYQGNSILDFTDPMNNIKDPFNNIKCSISLHVSKSMYNKIKKLRENA